MIEFLLRLFLGHKYRKQEEIKQIEKPKVVAIIPTYNESIDTLRKTIDSIELQVDKIIVVDDGSRVSFGGFEDYDITVIQQNNSGKSKAIANGMHYVPDDTDFVITCDSDTEFDKDFVKNALKRFKPSVGAIVGEVKIKNTTGFNDIFSVVYYYSFNIWRASMSYFGQVSVLSGACTMMRYKVAKSVMDDYVKRNIRIGEDRYLTYLILKEGWDTVFAPNAIAYTESPTGMKFIKQQLRWYRSFWDGVVYSRDLYLDWLFVPYTVDTLLQVLSRFTTILLWFAIIVCVYLRLWHVIALISAWLVISSTIRGLYGATAEKDFSFIPKMIVWGFVSVIFTPPLHMYALVTRKNGNWLTR